MLAGVTSLYPSNDGSSGREGYIYVDPDLWVDETQETSCGTTCTAAFLPLLSVAQTKESVTWKSLDETA